MLTHLTYSAYMELNNKHPAFASALEPRLRMRVRILMAAKVPTGARSPGKPWQQKDYSYFSIPLDCYEKPICPLAVPLHGL